MTRRRGPGPGGSRTGRLLPLLMAAALAPLLMAATAPPLPVTDVPAIPAPVETPAAALAIIDQALAEGRLDDADSTISRTRATTSSPQLQLRTAEVILARGDLPGAATAFADLHDLPDVAARSWQGSGIAALRQGRLAEAVTALDKALALDSNLPRAWNARGVAADKQRDWKRAEAAYARAIAVDPNMVPALSNRGYSLLLQGRFAEAEADLAKAVTREPGLAAARTNLRLARAMQGRYEEAFIGSTREGLANDLNTVGFAAMSRGDDATAEVYFNRALALSPQFDRIAAANLDYLKQRATRPDANSGSGPR
jgi:Flp pilus assembly protein TadD